MTSSSLSNERGNDYDVSKRESHKSCFLSHSLEEEEKERQEEELEVERASSSYVTSSSLSNERRNDYDVSKRQSRKS